MIGGRAGIGKGWRMLMECLADGRGISLPALSVGAAKLAVRQTGAYARVRRQFGRPIGDFERVIEPLARIAGQAYQMDAARCVFSPPSRRESVRPSSPQSSSTSSPSGTAR